MILIFLTETELAERHRRSVKTLQNERITGGGVPFVKLGRSVRYRISDIEAWENAHVVNSTSEPLNRKESHDEHEDSNR